MPMADSGSTTATQSTMPMTAPMAQTHTASMPSMPTIALGRIPMASSMPNSRVRSNTVMMKALMTDMATTIRSSQYIIDADARSI